MKIFAVSDLHLPGTMDKTMDMFGVKWQGHFEKIKDDWLNKVSEDDIVLIAGDISWAMHLSQAEPDLNLISELPGKKILIRGNHDFWWSSVSRVRDKLKENIFVLQNDAIKIGDYVFAGTRGWMDSEGEDNKKIFAREEIRLDLTLKSAKKLMDESSTLITMLHYPPIINKTKATAFCDIMESYGVKYCVYGHLHGVDKKEAEIFTRNGITYILSSCDMIDFTLREIETKKD
ncbi:MAG: serine/threonine protein phosphatase [Clostridiales bacterium]|nr:serine/threonine protein phosphatase [Clostridiales bacterium]